MQDLLLKGVRWYIVVLGVIAGIGLLHMADVHDSIKPVLPGLICLGFSFIAGTAWKDLRRKTLFYCIVIVTGLAYAAQYVPDVLYILTGRIIDLNYCVGWAVLCFIFGFPAMLYIFHKHGD